MKKSTIFLGLGLVLFVYGMTITMQSPGQVDSGIAAFGMILLMIGGVLVVAERISGAFNKKGKQELPEQQQQQQQPEKKSVLQKEFSLGKAGCLFFFLLFAYAANQDTTTSSSSYTPPPQPKESYEYMLATIDNGYVTRDSDTVKIYKRLLDRLETKYSNSRKKIADVSVAAKEMIEKTGRRQSVIDILMGLDNAVSSDMPKQDVAEMAAMIVAIVKNS